MPEGGGDGMIVTEGGRFGGIGLYILKGKPVFDYNMLTLAQHPLGQPGALTPGKHTIVFDFTYDGPGIAKGGTGVLKVDGKEVDNHKQPNSIAFLEVTDETFDVGVDTRTGVNDDDYQVPPRLQWHDRQADLQNGPAPDAAVRRESCKGCRRESERLASLFDCETRGPCPTRAGPRIHQRVKDYATEQKQNHETRRLVTADSCGVRDENET